MFPQTLSAERTFIVLQSGGKLESDVVQAREAWGKKTCDCLLSSSIPCLVRAEQHLAGNSHTVRWDGDWKKSRMKGRSCRDIVLLPTQYQPVEFAHCVGENTLCLRMDFRSRSDPLHSRLLCLLSLES